MPRCDTLTKQMWFNRDLLQTYKYAFIQDMSTINVGAYMGIHTNVNRLCMKSWLLLYWAKA